MFENFYFFANDKEAEYASAFVPGKPLKPSPKKYQNRVESHAKDERPSLFGLFVGDEEKKVYDIDT
jgi:hypothetical protein